MDKVLCQYKDGLLEYLQADIKELKNISQTQLKVVFDLFDIIPLSTKTLD